MCFFVSLDRMQTTEFRWAQVDDQSQGGLNHAAVEVATSRRPDTVTLCVNKVLAREILMHEILTRGMACTALKI